MLKVEASTALVARCKSRLCQLSWHVKIMIQGSMLLMWCIQILKFCI